MTDILLAGHGLSKSFGGVSAVKDVTIELGSGAPITTIIGPNGAGKTTLLNLLCGALPPDRGEILFHGRDITALGMRKRMLTGIARTFQHTGIFGGLTPRQHFTLMAGKAAGGLSPLPIDQLLATFNLAEFADDPAEKLNHVSRRLLEIGMIVAASPAVLMLDEPTAGMDLSEIEQLASVIRSLRNSVQIMIIEHDIDFVLGISDRIVVLDQGSIIADGTPAQVQGDERVADAYMRRGH